MYRGLSCAAGRLLNAFWRGIGSILNIDVIQGIVGHHSNRIYYLVLLFKA